MSLSPLEIAWLAEEADLAYLESLPKAGNSTPLAPDCNICLCKCTTGVVRDYRCYPPDDRLKIANVAYRCYLRKNPIVFLWEVRKRDCCLFFDLDGVDGVEVSSVVDALYHCLFLGLPSKFTHNKESQLQSCWIDGRRAGKPLSFHVHFPYVVVDYAAREVGVFILFFIYFFFLFFLFSPNAAP